MLPIALALAQFAPMLAGLLGGPKAQDIAAHVVGIAQTVTGQTTPEAALASIQADPATALQFQTAVVASQVQMAQIAAGVDQAQITASAQNATDINATMRAEMASEHWPTYSWRPAIGFAVAIALLLAVIIVGAAYVSVMFFGVKADLLQYVPGMLAALTGLVVGIAAPILGVASWFRGKMQADPTIPSVNRG